jgi:class 3 adenylate cyclase
LNALARVVYRLFADFWSDDAPEAQWQLVLRGEDPALRRYRHILALLPASPRCQFCNAPFRGPLAPLMQLIDRGPSRLNPRFCRMCLETIPVGGAEIEHTMLFADVRGSTSLAEQMGAFNFGRLINRFYVAGTEVLTHSDALIERLAGDQLIGLYIPGFAGAGHAQKAVRAGEELLRATGHGSPEGPWIPVGVGVHTGVAFVGAVGTDGGLTNVTALGDAVNIAARLSSLAAPGEMLVSQEAAAGAGLPADRLERRSLEIKGRSEPVDACVLRLVA